MLLEELRIEVFEQTVKNHYSNMYAFIDISSKLKKIKK